MRYTLIVLLQAILVVIMLFVPFGLDQNSSWGLNYGHFFLILAIYIVTLLVGLIETVVDYKWTYVMIQAAVLMLAVVAYLK